MFTAARLVITTAFRMVYPLSPIFIQELNVSLADIAFVLTGAQLLGLNGIVIISHGSSKAKAIRNAVKVALEGLKNDLVNKITEEAKA